MQVGDLVKYIDTYDIHDIGVGSIGIIICDYSSIQRRIKRAGRFYSVLFGDKQYNLPFHHIQEVK